MSKSTEVSTTEAYNPLSDIRNLQQRLMAYPELKEVMDGLFEMATDPSSKDRLGAIKEILARAAPIQSFVAATTEKQGASDRQQINIRITGVAGVDPEKDVTSVIDIEVPQGADSGGAEE